jgi:hypothetical protein
VSRLGRTKIEITVTHLGIEADDALAKTGRNQLRNPVAIPFQRNLPLSPIRPERLLNVPPKLIRLAVIGLVVLIGSKGVPAIPQRSASDRRVNRGNAVLPASGWPSVSFVHRLDEKY